MTIPDLLYILRMVTFLIGSINLTLTSYIFVHYAANLKKGYRGPIIAHVAKISIAYLLLTLSGMYEMWQVRHLPWLTFRLSMLGIAYVSGIWGLIGVLDDLIKKEGLP